MKKLAVLNKIDSGKIMAIVRTQSLERAKEIAAACLAGGVSCLEISYTHFNASHLIEELHKEYGEELLIGAGTVLDSETAWEAIMRGAQFIIAPTFKEDVAKICNRYQIAYMPGCTTVTEAVAALEASAAMIKAFPTSSFWGPNLVAALKTPLPFIPLLSSGGVTLENVDAWLEAGVDCMGIGSLLTNGNAHTIEEHARLLRQAVKRYIRRS
ncbi:ketohydroxyglutarate aldolase [Streptococcus chenjunshii]|uniref:Ketohydroxyglutarate aldolase n=1 Tax=Streptococcus chenjunshii TaxID=2173853 RepID=A0A372KMN2_9STRE|nr:ketohydroxyglutarate aldolase [Streptococcus chenjunshii]AXQ79561.1 ketohydroxyglutarate aldolase [Streptococcus chenjunshii]RFU51476.1 ketohydroxyglutarate aldolase [Streptococcus chenjunshii]RFU53542.1 ketohydroxyglutarate aldolase [Streptococcus chenjunshii]